MSTPILFARAIGGQTLERASAVVFGLADNAAHLLRPLIGKVVEVRLEPPGLKFFIAVNDSGLEMLDHHPAPDASVVGSPLTFVSLGLGSDPQTSLFKGELQLLGDLHVARAFQRLLKDLHIDWTELAGRYIGADLATKLAAGLRGGKTWADESSASLAMTAGEFLQQETRIVPSPQETEGWLRDIERLRDDTERVAARIERLAAAQREP